MCAPRKRLEKPFRRAAMPRRHIDALQYAAKLFSAHLSTKAYISMLQRAPELMGVLYTDGPPWQHPRRRLALDRLNTGAMIRLLNASTDLCLRPIFFRRKSLRG